jgi:hypothetical protein
MFYITFQVFVGVVDQIKCDVCVLTLRRNILPPSSGYLFLVQVDAEVVGKKGMNWLCGKLVNIWPIGATGGGRG